MNPFAEKGTPLERQSRSWKQVVQAPFRKQEVDAFTRCRTILMDAIEAEACYFSHAYARMCTERDIKETLARLRLVEHQQQNTIRWLTPPDQGVLETAIAYEQAAIEITAYLAQREPDEYVKAAFDFGLLEDIDHLYRFSQVLDLVHGKDPNEILQGRTDVLPGRPTPDHHNDPALRILQPYGRRTASPLTRSHVLTLTACEQQTLRYYTTNGNAYGTPEVRQLFAEISEAEEEHVSQYESLMDPSEPWIEKWVLHEFNEVANYYTCYMTEVDTRIKQIWEQFLHYEIEHLHIAADMLQKHENRDAREVCGIEVAMPAMFETNRDYIALMLQDGSDVRLVSGGEWARRERLPSRWESLAYQNALNQDGAPSEAVVAMRESSAGADLVRSGDHVTSSNAGDEFHEELEPSGLNEEVARLGPLATYVEDYHLRTTARGANGREGGRARRSGRR